MGQLLKFYPSRLVGVCTGYKRGDLVAAVASVTLRQDDGLLLQFPKTNPFSVGEPVTVHLDDRVATDTYSIELRVHRASYKGRVTSVKGLQAQVSLVHYELFYGSGVVASERAPGYQHPAETRSPRPLAESPLKALALVDDNERSNQLGVLVTRAPERPHTTVMAFLSSVDDSLFFITHPSTFKYQMLLRDPDCAFALDHRATFSFEREVDWNYTIFAARAHRIERSSPVFRSVQEEFVHKNPWEEAFFTSPEAAMLHLVPRRILQQDVLCP